MPPPAPKGAVPQTLPTGPRHFKGNPVNGSNTIYQGRIVSLRIEPVTLPNGECFDMEIVSHPGGAAAVAVDEAGRVCLLHQYRHAVGGWLWELPAGKIDGHEPPQTTAQRTPVIGADARLLGELALGGGGGHRRR